MIKTRQSKEQRRSLAKTENEKANSNEERTWRGSAQGGRRLRLVGGQLALVRAGLAAGADRLRLERPRPDDLRHQAGRRHQLGYLLRAPLAVVEPARVVRHAAEPVHRLRDPDGPVLPGRADAAAARLGDRAAVALAPGRGRLLGPDQARHGAADRL